jgi:hypothetical protein
LELGDGSGDAVVAEDTPVEAEEEEEEEEEPCGAGEVDVVVEAVDIVEDADDELGVVIIRVVEKGDTPMEFLARTCKYVVVSGDENCVEKVCGAVTVAAKVNGPETCYF